MGRPSSLQRHWLTRLGWGYAALIAAWLVLRGLAFDRLWWLALLNTDALALFLPLAVLLPLAIWRRRAHLLAALAVPVVGSAASSVMCCCRPWRAPPSSARRSRP